MRILLAAVAVLGVSACASMEPKPCTPEWVEWKKERVFNEFAREHRQEIENMRKMVAAFVKDEGPDRGFNAATLQFAMSGLGVLRLIGDFAESAVPAVREGIEKCGSSPRTAQLFADMLRKEGFDPKAAEAIESLGLWMDMQPRSR